MPELKNPKIVIHNMREKYSEDVFIEKIKKQNVQLEHRKMKIIAIRETTKKVN